MLYYNENKMNKYNIRRMVPSKRITTSNMNNYMKKMFITFICLLAVISISAQTQQGYVKTKGRLGNNGSIISGSRIQGATIQIKGRTAVLSQANGTFSFPIPAQKFYLQNVQKQGFVLTDPDILSRQHSYSADPLVLVIEDKAQQEAERRAIERKISRKLYAELEKRQDEIDALLEQNKISEEKYRELQQQLNKDQDDNASIIKEMAERYMKIDFDEVDDFNRQISDCIINGRLTEADSLLRTKGDISERFNKLSQHHEANVQARAELEKSEEMEKKNREDLAQDCFSKFEIFRMQHQNDSAGFYLELRTLLDSTNVNWLDFTGYYYYTYLADNEKALYYFVKELEQSILQYGERSTNVATAYNNIALTFMSSDKNDAAAQYLEKALNINKELLDGNNTAMADNYLNLGAIMNKKGKFIEALQYEESAKIIYKTLEENKLLLLNLSRCFDHIAQSYVGLGNYSDALTNNLEALRIRLTICQEDDIALAYSYNNLADTYFLLKDFEKAIDNGEKALKIASLIYGEKHPFTATCYSNIGKVYSETKEYQKAIDHYQKSLLIRNTILGNNHSDVALCYNNLGVTYNYMKQYEDAIRNHELALSIRRSIYGEPSVFVGASLYNIGAVYDSKGDLRTALIYYNKALKTFTELYPDNHPNTNLVIKKINGINSRL